VSLIEIPPRTGSGQALEGAFPSPNRGAFHTLRSSTYISGNQRLMRNDAPILAEAEAHIVFKADWRFIANFTRNIASNCRTKHGQIGERGSAKLPNGMQSNSRIEYGQIAE
jgi:hypothetical protein